MANPSGSDFLLSSKEPAPGQRSWLPWIVAGVLIAGGLAALVLFGGKKPGGQQPGGTALAPADPYAQSLPLTSLQMSEASNFAGGKVTYLDGQIANQGSKTVTGITVQVAFHNALGELSQKETLPLNLIRTHSPYIDTQSISAAPIGPGEQREFRLIFDHVTADWNQEYPELRIIQVQTRP